MKIILLSTPWSTSISPLVLKLGIIDASGQLRASVAFGPGMDSGTHWIIWTFWRRENSLLLGFEPNTAQPVSLSLYQLFPHGCTPLTSTNKRFVYVSRLSIWKRVNSCNVFAGCDVLEWFQVSEVTTRWQRMQYHGPLWITWTRRRAREKWFALHLWSAARTRKHESVIG